MKTVFLTSMTFMLLGFCFKQFPERTPLPQGDCEWCGAAEAPKDLSWKTTIPPEGEAGEPLIISGIIFKADGKTPAKDILVYVYHTNQKGIYPKRGDETGNGRRHGYLRAWMKTDAKGRYQFETIKPASYPGHRSEPAHIHITLSGPGYPEYWLNSYWFEGDPLISQAALNKLTRTGGFSNVIKLSKNKNGLWRGSRNFILQKDFK